jgi:hypothetical protein
MIAPMIRRDAPGVALLINQYDHSLLSGELARRIGNGLFAPPTPFEPACLAIAEHDCGWAGIDVRPDLNAQGLPAHVFEGDTQTSLAAWQASVDIVADQDAYAGLLVSLHSMALANFAMSRETPAVDEVARQKAFRMRKFVHGQIELQEKLRRNLDMHVDLPLRGGLAEEGRSPDEDLLRCNFFLMQFLDQISLDLCFDRLMFSRIDTVYPRAGEGPIAARIARDDDATMKLDPWPFNEELLEFTVPAREIAAGPYANSQALHAACAAAQPCEVRVVLQAW